MVDCILCINGNSNSAYPNRRCSATETFVANHLRLRKQNTFKAKPLTVILKDIAEYLLRSKYLPDNN